MSQFHVSRDDTSVIVPDIKADTEYEIELTAFTKGEAFGVVRQNYKTGNDCWKYRKHLFHIIQILIIVYNVAVHYLVKTY